jgi:uncharacterized protein (TIGR00255 family)
MTVYSMTGYATAACEPVGGGAGAGVTVDARSVNGRFLDLSLRLPDDLRSLEPALREMAGALLRRGKVELRITSAREANEGWPQPTAEQLGRLLRLQETVQGWLPGARELTINEVMHWCRGGTGNEKLDAPALEAARHCLDGLREARAREGARLVTLLLERVTQLRTLAAQAEPLVPAVVQRQQQRFLERWAEALASPDAGARVPPEALQERALAEAAAYAIRIDVAEELGRLRAHLDEIERLLAKGGELGKRLDFLIQELQREANTLGSKSSALELSSIAVNMKVAIEQMREQVQNIE